MKKVYTDNLSVCDNPQAKSSSTYIFLQLVYYKGFTYISDYQSLTHYHVCNLYN